MNQDEKKFKVAEVALEYIESGQIVGIGTGSTVNCLISLFNKIKNKIDGVVSSSESTTKLLMEQGLRVLELREAGRLPLYIDGADEANSFCQLIKGGGGALTREKIVAQASDTFICIIDDTKLVDKLGKFPLPVETLETAQSLVSLEIVKMGGKPVLRESFTTDNGNPILDIHNLDIFEPIKIEKAINNIPGVVTNGLFALRPADKLLIGYENNVDVLETNV
ncbi:MAG: ribose-5-phosphate isomerase RpiA [Pseudomonadota bacterium]|nr:ribose-5-phosphate isomerase RpiA [Pseudomonadota bacterium]